MYKQTKPILDMFRTRLVAQFWRRITKTNHCWLWTGAKNDRGYGKVAVNHTGRAVSVYVHRLSYLIHFGEFDQSLYVLHKCDNPSCVNPEHLFLGTMNDNTADMLRKHRQSRHEKRWSATITMTIARKIRELNSSGQYTRNQLAELFCTNSAIVGRVIRHEKWKEDVM